jgi:hypothetical protein
MPDCTDPKNHYDNLKQAVVFGKPADRSCVTREARVSLPQGERCHEIKAR